ncbi:hypothetical protein [Amycolatopsis sp. WGS_07]|uniref:hypothetical protein n=1 Tax=Amycolatopsis sp. WGS_07 TaxID=3076764 RepID=UPI003872EDA3
MTNPAPPDVTRDRDALRNGEILGEEFADCLIASCAGGDPADSGDADSQGPAARHLLSLVCRDRTLLESFCHSLADQAQRFRAAVRHLQDDWIDRSETTPDWIARHIDRTGDLADGQVLDLAHQLDQASGYLAQLADVPPPRQFAEPQLGAAARRPSRRPCRVCPCRSLRAATSGNGHSEERG